MKIEMMSRFQCLLTLIDVCYPGGSFAIEWQLTTSLSQMSQNEEKILLKPQNNFWRLIYSKRNE